ncbi:MAG: hypothetical protein HYW25_04660 [Candidatus Aenigmarchaeota archaeon]|nr:hypothetical protein [Candidatus Aenigmarchaeota archaeon]
MDAIQRFTLALLEEPRAVRHVDVATATSHYRCLLGGDSSALESLGPPVYDLDASSISRAERLEPGTAAYLLLSGL